MSEDGKVDPAAQALLDSIRQEIDAESLRRFWEEKLADAKCEMCGSESWWRLEEPSRPYSYFGIPIAAYDPKGENHGPLEYAPLPFWLLSCANCGNTKLMLRRLFGDWKRGIELPKPPGAE